MYAIRSYYDPEKSTSYEISLKKKTVFESGSILSNSLTAGYIDVKDRITSALTGYEGATPVYEYINISQYVV